MIKFKKEKDPTTNLMVFLFEEQICGETCRPLVITAEALLLVDVERLSVG